MEENIIKYLLKNKNFNTAMEFALKKHNGQKRLEGTPYIFHPVRTYHILSNIFKESGNQAFIILNAALLHDTIEDTKTTGIELSKNFDEEIRQIVEELTNPKEITHSKKGAYLAEKLLKISDNALTIKLADRLDNISNLEILSINKKNRYLSQTKQILKSIENSRFTDSKQDYLLTKLYDKIETYEPNIYSYKERDL